MAKVLAEFDTVTKAFSLTLDGEAMKADYVSFHPSYDDPEKYCFSCSMNEKDKESGVTTWTQVAASVHDSFLDEVNRYFGDK